MARIELRDATIRLKDGLSGTAAINQPSPAPAEDDTTMTIDNVDLNTSDTDQVPIGAKFTVAGETASDTVHTVTARTPTSGTTTDITFTPALGAGTYADDGVITFQPQELDIKIGEGNLTYTESREMTYVLDRGNLDSVREGNQVPVEVNLEFVYEFVTSESGGSVTPVDALKQKNEASEWVTSSSDACEPYAVDIEIYHNPPCGSDQDETTVFPDFRYESLEFDLNAATISVSGRANATEPTVTRSA